LLLAGLLYGEALGQEPFRLIPEVRFLLGMESSYQWLWGNMLIPAGGRPGSGNSVDFLGDLGVDRGEASAVSLQVTVLDNHVFYADFLMFSPTAVKKAPRTFRFHNQTYTEGSEIETRIDFNWLHASYGYKLWSDPSWWVAPKIGVNYLVYSATLNGKSEEADVTSNNRTLDGTYPVLGLEARYLFPHGLDLSAELEGVHLITRGYLSTLRLGVTWEIYPDVVTAFSCSNRLVQYVEDHQPLNNEWFANMIGLSAAISFSF